MLVHPLSNSIRIILIRSDVTTLIGSEGDRSVVFMLILATTTEHG